MATVGDLGVGNLAYRANLDGGISVNNPTTGDGRLVLPIWAGEVLHAYDQYNIFEPMVESSYHCIRHYDGIPSDRIC